MKNAKKSTSIKAFLRGDKKFRQKAFWKMKHNKLYVYLIVTTAVLLLLSFVFRKCGWISSFLQSCGVGALTGVIVFWLGNVRGTEKERIELKVQQLSVLSEIYQSMYNSVPDTFNIKFSNKKYDYAQCVWKLICEADKYVEAIKSLHYEFYKDLILNANVEINKIVLMVEKLKNESISDNITLAEAEKIKKEIIYVTQNVNDWVDSELREAEIQLRQLYDYPL